MRKTSRLSKRNHIGLRQGHRRLQASDQGSQAPGSVIRAWASATRSSNHLRQQRCTRQWLQERATAQGLANGLTESKGLRPCCRSNWLNTTRRQWLRTPAAHHLRNNLGGRQSEHGRASRGMAIFFERGQWASSQTTFTRTTTSFCGKRLWAHRKHKR